MPRDIVTKGQVVFDADRTEPGENAPLVVIDPNPGTVREQDAETRKAIREAERNGPYDTSPTADCVDVVYLSDSMSDMVYTFPKDRIVTPDYNENTLGYPPSVWSKAEMLVELYRELPIDDITAMDGEIEGKVLLAARDIMASEGIEEDSISDEGYLRELMDCPECESDVTLKDGIESTGEGVAFAYVYCQNEDCGWEGREEWVHRQTTPVSSEGVSVGEPTKAYFGED